MTDLFAYKARRDKGAKHKVFEDSFDAKIIENANLFIEKLKYIHNNPCKKPWCLADAPEKYAWSSASKSGDELWIACTTKAVLRYWFNSR